MKTPGSNISQKQAFSTESNQSQSSIHLNIMVPGVTGNFLLEHPVYWISCSVECGPAREMSYLSTKFNSTQDVGK